MSRDIEAEKREVESKPNDKLTREQRRRIERLQKEAGQQLADLVNYFYQFFMSHDPVSEEVANKFDEVCAKWKMYCHRRGLKKEALSLCETRCAELVMEYEKIKKEK